MPSLSAEVTMVFLDKPLFSRHYKEPGPEGGPAQLAPPLDMGIALADVHSIQIDGDPDAARYLMTIIDKGDNTLTWEIDAGGQTPTKVQVGNPGTRTRIGNVPVGLPRRQPIDLTLGGIRYRAAKGELEKRGDSTLLILELYRNFMDASPSSAIPTAIPAPHANSINLVCLYGPPNAAANSLLVLGFSKINMSVWPVSGWILTAEGNLAPTVVPNTLTSQVYKRSNSPSGGAAPESLSSCEEICQLFILYSPGNPDMVELKNCNGTWTQTPIDTARNEVLEIVDFTYDEETCTSISVEYRAYPPTDVAEVDCTQTKAGSAWNEPSCTSPEELTLLGRSRFFVEVEGMRVLAEFSMLLDDATGEITSAVRQWSSNIEDGNPAFACPVRDKYSEQGTATVEAAVGAAPESWKGNHAAAKANGGKSFARTEGHDFGSGVVNLALRVQ